MGLGIGDFQNFTLANFKHYRRDEIWQVGIYSIRGIKDLQFPIHEKTEAGVGILTQDSWVENLSQDSDGNSEKAAPRIHC